MSRRNKIQKSKNKHQNALIEKPTKNDSTKTILRKSNIELVRFEKTQNVGGLDPREEHAVLLSGDKELPQDNLEHTKLVLRKHFAREEGRSAAKPRSPQEIVGSIMKRIHESRLKGDNYEHIVESVQCPPVLIDGQQSISEVMTKNVTCIIDSTTIEQLAGLFNKRKINAIPVVDYKTLKFVGLINMVDILSYTLPKKMFSLVHEGKLVDDSNFGMDILNEPVRNFMNPSLFSEVSPQCTVKHACEIMVNKKLHHLVITFNNRVNGIFSSFDALKILANQFS